MSGTVNISRDIWHDAAFKPEPFTEREAWIWLVMEARYKPGERRVGNVVAHLDRGQLAASVRFMAEAWGWTKSRVDRFLKRLENRDMIGTDSGTGLNIITVCKYDEYQAPLVKAGQPKSQKRDSSGTAAGQQRDKPNKGVIKGKEGNDSFDEFWSIVPRKVAKGDARKAYARALKKTDSATLFSAMKAYAATRVGQDERYTKHPASWLNAEQWEDAQPQLTPINGGNNESPNSTDRLQRVITAAATGTSGKDWG
ncbi:hypothetical protein [Ruegeria sp. HKCCA4812]|uniref:hypothetical protein n=1 Tax=Ruegeria sp. HKCCA4812 TaxID=2682993 RepID=UPI00158235F8|nr:hypothetical protein [Ruegeria sp. HKCCA4812]